MHVQEALDRYVTQLQADGRSPHTVGQARRLVGQLVCWMEEGHGPTEVRRLGHEHVAAFLVSPVVTRTQDGRPRKASSGNAIRSALRQFGRWVVDAGYTSQNPARLVRLARHSPAPPRSLSNVEVARLLAAIDRANGPLAERDGVLVRLLLGTGLRLGSALALRVEDVDLTLGELRITRAKNNAPITLPISRDIADVLGAHLPEAVDGWLFPGRQGGAMTTRQATYRIGSLARSAGLPGRATAHALRHTYGQRLYDRTHDVLLVRAALGHQSLQSTMVYARAGQQALRVALRE